MADNVRMAREGTTFYDGVVNISWGAGGNPEIVAAPPAGRSAELVSAIQSGSVIETEDAVTAAPPAPPAPAYVRLSAPPADGDTLVYNAATGLYDPGAATGALPTEIASIPTAEMDSTTFLAPDGTGGVEWVPPPIGFENPMTLAGDLIYMNPTGGEVVATEAGPFGPLTNSSGGTRVTGLVTGHRIRLTCNTSRSGPYDDFLVIRGYITGSSGNNYACSVTTDPTRVPNGGSVTLTLTLSGGATEVEAWQIPGPGTITISNLVWEDLDVATPDSLPIGSTGEVLTVIGGVPSWEAMSVRNASGVPSGSPAAGEIPLAFDSTITTGGLYIWSGSAWVKVSTIP